ncbi:hypothetical protein DPMN_172364 [Dreissena polymorpha]|uniref:Uncharacterized protein n=2 Tax=Dreissena polymorpha TaxID=45954 RepID=A0A9D4IF22_DREPO|nr:hypothetical protein DPMN_172364 [Dreissena polymorpha]
MEVYLRDDNISESESDNESVPESDHESVPEPGQETESESEQQSEPESDMDTSVSMCAQDRRKVNLIAGDSNVHRIKAILPDDIAVKYLPISGAKFSCDRFRHALLKDLRKMDVQQLYLHLGSNDILTNEAQKRHKQNLRQHHGQIISTRRPNRVLTRRIAVALGIDQRIDAESVFTSRTFAEIMKLHRKIDHDSQMTPIDFEVTRSKDKVTAGLIDILSKNGCLADASDVLGRTPLHMAALKGHQNIICVKAILILDSLRSRADINAANDMGETPLHLAAKWGYGETPLHLSAKWGYGE